MPTSQTTAPLASSAVSPPLRLGVRAGGVVLVLVFCLTLLCAIGIASCFRLSSAPRALRRSVMESVPGQWDKRFAVNVGGFTLGFVRFGSRFFNLPPEPKAALEALRGAEVGVYKLRNPPPALDYSAVFKAADDPMRRRGWERIVGVAQGGQLVAVYMPRGIRTLKRTACCVVVLNQEDLVVVSARGNVEPLLELERVPLNIFATKEPSKANVIFFPMPASPNIATGNSKAGICFNPP